MHRLANGLNRSGHQAYLLFFNGQGLQTEWFYSDRQEFYCPDFSYAFVDPLSFKPDTFLKDAIVVYPEIISGNPLNAGKVVRYFLNGEGIIKKGVRVMASPTDFILAWANLFHPDPHFVLNFDFDEPSSEKVPNLMARDICCTYIGKGEKYLQCHIVPGTTEITRTHPAAKEDYVALLKRTRFIYLWDAVTAVYNDAVLYGALPVMMTYLPFTREQWNAATKIESELPLPDQFSKLEELDHVFQAYRNHYLKNRLTSSSSYESKVGELTEKLSLHFAKDKGLSSG